MSENTRRPFISFPGGWAALMVLVWFFAFGIRLFHVEATDQFLEIVALAYVVFTLLEL